jgi:hypothetical protein
MSAKLSLLNKYMLSSMILNGICKSVDIYDAKVKRANNEKTNLLLAEKITIISIHTLAGGYLLPFRLYDNINKLELKLRNEEYNKYYSYNPDYKSEKKCNTKVLTISEHFFDLNKFY